MVHQKSQDALKTFTLKKYIYIYEHMDKNVRSPQLDVKFNFHHMSMNFSQPMFRPICWQVSNYISYFFETNNYKEL